MKIIELDSIDSTNDEARRLIKNGDASDNIVIWAKSQTGGRGRMDRVWQSPEGNLYFSIILQNPLGSNSSALKIESWQLSFIAAIAVGSVLANLIPSDPDSPSTPEYDLKYKWPNDILINERKISGILLESIGTVSKTDWVIVGIGINVNKLPEGQTNLPATSLSNCDSADINIKDLLTNIIYRFNEEVDLWKEQGFKSTSLRWLEKSYKISEENKAILQCY